MDIVSADKDSWNNAESIIDGTPSLIRYRPDLEYLLGHKDYPRKLTIFWDYEKKENNGLPTDEQMEEMRKFEDVVVPALDLDRLAIFVLAFTKDGTREWHFYTGDIGAVGKRFNESLSSFPKLPIELQVETDENWDKLRQIYEICSKERT
ncbi:DUF695 domain-containing protein [Glaciecola sp. MH2013]|uniref:DUF695 domain-containing protein n=1 Tax=Glaciecola sp. MH2013 TaxID=2785524 RepID=UPI00189E835C|nr:DUF695 domain-containing protein [Glaciecola sp. MH2013]MBF7074450.1 DUF695 domain-containing protein [Glaciecola sp. MH2013]